MHPTLFFEFQFGFGPVGVPPVRIVVARWALNTNLISPWRLPEPKVSPWKVSPMCASGIEWSMIRGEDLTFTLVPDPLPVDITGWSLRWMLRATSGGAISVTKDNAGTGGISIVDAKQGLISVTVLKADTSALAIQTTPWFWELRRYDAGASTALAKGTLSIAQEDATP